MVKAFLTTSKQKHSGICFHWLTNHKALRWIFIFCILK